MQHPQEQRRRRINENGGYIPRDVPQGAPPTPMPGMPPVPNAHNGNMPPNNANGGIPPFTFNAQANSPNGSNSSNDNLPSPWGNPDVKTFTTCLNTVDMLNGLNWLQFKFKLTILAEANGLAQFLYQPPQGHPYPTTTILQQEYRRYSTAMFNGVYSRSSPSIQHELRPLVGTPTPATNAWHFLTSKYEAIDIRLQLQLQEQLLGLRLDNGKADKYLSKARELRDRMITAQLPVTSSHFNGYLLHGLPDSWESFKSSIKLQLHTLSEDHLGNLILQEDRDRTYKRTTSDSYRSTSEAMLATKSSCDVCGKDGHVRAQCFFEPPYYCPRCKEKGHKPTECPKRNTRNNNANNNFKGNNRSRNNNHNKNKTYAQEASMHMETMLHMEYGEHALATKKMHGPSTSNPHEWIVDSGCTKHMTPYVIQLNNYERLVPPIPVMTGSREVIYAIGIGDAPVLTNTNTPITLRKVLHVPKLMYPLMSVVQIVKNHGDVLTKKHTIQVRRNDKLILTAPHKRGLFRTILRVRPTFDPHFVNHVQEPLSPKGYTSLSMEQDKDAFILAWHKKLGHASHGAMQIMVKHNMAHGLPFKFVPKFKCHDCEIAKLTQQPYQLAQHLPSTEKLGLVHTDICGPVPTSMEGYRYFATLTDDATRFKWILPLKTKGEVITKIIEWLPYAERQSGAKMKAIRSDHGMEFKSSTLENFLKERGIEHQFSIVYHPPQNGVAERTNRTLVERTRAMLLTARMPTKYWKHAMEYALWLINRSPSKALEDKRMSPYEAWHGKKANLAGVHTFGCKVNGFIPKALRDNKFSPSGQPLVFLGMSDNHKGWVLYNPIRRTYEVVRTAKFHDDVMHFPIPPSNQVDSMDGYTFDVEDTLPPEPCDDVFPSMESNTKTPIHEGEEKLLNEGTTNVDHLDLTEGLETMVEEEEEPPPRRSSRLTKPLTSPSPSKGEKWIPNLPPGEEDVSPTYFRDLLGAQMPSLNQETENEFSALTITTSDHTSEVIYDQFATSLKALITTTKTLPKEPSTVKEALNGPHANDWKKAMDAEMATLTERGTWELVELPKGQRPVGVKWVFKVKTNADGSIERFKARLVAKGFTQVHMQDYFETYAPVSDYTTARLLLAVVAVKQLHLVQLDVKNAFLYGGMDATVFMKQPEGYDDGSHRACKLIKSLYGLKQSPRMWYQRLSDALTRIGFRKSIHDHALFMRTNNKNECTTWCLVYVDDILMASSMKEEIHKCITQLQKEFTLTIVEKLTQFLGMNLNYDMNKGELSLKADKYIEKLESKFHVTTTKRCLTPLFTPPLEDPSREPIVTEFYYQSRVGSLIYAATCCRPDIQFPVNFVSQGNQTRNEAMVKTVDRILAYVVQTKSVGLTYGGPNTDLILKGYSDASFGANAKNEDQRSSYGWIFVLGGCAISWVAKRHSTTSLSTAEAELMAAKEAIAQATHLRALLEDVETPQRDATTIYIDSQAAYQASIGEGFSKRLKHVNVALQWVREMIINNTMTLELIRTTEQAADFLTKALPREQHETCCRKVGLHLTDAREDKDSRSKAQGGMLETKGIKE